MQSTEENLKNIQAQISGLELRYHRVDNEVQLMAVSKKKPIALIQQAYQCGQRIFGESYVQEAIEKKAALADLGDIQWHFIGPIQSNKTRDVATHFDWVHSVDRLKIMQRLNQQRNGNPLNVCLQVNIDDEPTKSGFKVNEIITMATQVIDMPNLRLRGLMAIPKPNDTLAAQRATFKRVSETYEQLQLLSQHVDTLSIGMSGDMEAAIAEGSTMVRIGTAIFGSRG